MKYLEHIFTKNYFFFHLIWVLAFYLAAIFLGRLLILWRIVFFPFPGLIDNQTNIVLCPHVALQSHLKSSLRAQTLPEIL